MAYTQTTRTSYGKRLGNSLGGVVFGLLLFLAGTVLIWWNEGRSVRTDKMLKEAQANTVEMVDISRIDPAFEGKLVHATGLATTADSLIDSQFKVGTRAIALHRSVEYYQWVEHSQSQSKDKFGGAQEVTTEYTYDLQWVPRPISSADFQDPDYKNENFVRQEVENADKYAQNVSFGAYKLNSSQITSIGGSTPLAVVDSTGSNVIYIGEDLSKPDVGDVRITFTQVKPAEVSIIACVAGDSFVPYKAKNEETFSVLRMGNVTQEQIFETEHSANKMWLWVLRILGFILIITGLRSFFGMLETILKVVPFLSTVVGWGVGLFCTVVGFVWGLIVLLLAWAAHRPVVLIVLLVVVGAAVWFFVTRSKKKEDTPVPPAAPAE